MESPELVEGTRGRALDVPGSERPISKLRYVRWSRRPGWRIECVTTGEPRSDSDTDDPHQLARRDDLFKLRLRSRWGWRSAYAELNQSEKAHKFRLPDVLEC